MSKITSSSRRSKSMSIRQTASIRSGLYEKFTALVAFANLFSEVNFAFMTTGQVLIWDAVAKKFHAGSN